MKGLKLDLMTVLVLFVVASVFFTMASGFGNGKEIGYERSSQSGTSKTVNTVIPAGNAAVEPGAAAQSKIIRASTKALWN